MRHSKALRRTAVSVGSGISGLTRCWMGGVSLTGTESPSGPLHQGQTAEGDNGDDKQPLQGLYTSKDMSQNVNLTKVFCDSNLAHDMNIERIGGYTFKEESRGSLRML